jgi:hypothetical protein
MKSEIFEASLNRIYNDFKNTEFVIITSSPSGNNKSNLQQLKSTIQSNGLGYIRIDGVGQEEVDGKVVPANEPSLLVKNVKKGGDSVMKSTDFTKLMFKLAKQYNQWGIVLSSPDKGTRMVAFKDDKGNPTSAKVLGKMSAFHPKKTAQFFSKLKGSSFTFEGFKYADPPENWIHGMSMEQMGESEISKYETTENWMNAIQKILSKNN